MAEEIQKRPVNEISKVSYNNGVVLGVQGGKAVTYGVNEAGGLVTTDKVNENLTFGAVQKGDKNVVSGDTVNTALSVTIESELIKSKEESGFIRTDGTKATASFFKIVWYNYNNEKEVKVSTIITAQDINLISYFDSNDIFLGGEYLLTSTSETKIENYRLNIPQGCKKIAINASKNQDVKMVYSEVGEKADFSIMYQNKKDIEVIKNNLNLNDKLMKVNILSDKIHIRTKYSNTEDLLIEYIYNIQNNNITPNQSFLGSNSLTNEQLLSTENIHYTWDSTGPIWMAEYWYLFAQHGYLVPTFILNGHGKTQSDIDSVWKDNNNREYTLGKIEGSKIWLLPKINIGTPEGNDTRDWKVHSNNNYTTLTHISGGVNTASMTPTSKDTDQLRPISTPLNRKFIVDGNKVGLGEYYCDEFIVSETLECLNPTKVTEWFPTPKNNGNMVVMNVNFTFIGMGCSVNTTFDVKYPLLSQYYGANQAINLKTKGNFKSYAFIPKLKNRVSWDSVVWNFNKEFLTEVENKSDAIFNRETTHLLDVNQMPDRIVSYIKDSSNNHKLGFASGMSLTRGLTVKEKQNENIAMGKQCLRFNPPGVNKSYFFSIDSSKFPNSIIPKDFYGEINYYFTYFNPEENKGLYVYPYKDGNKWVIYIHTNELYNKKEIKLPSYLENKEFKVLEQSNIDLLSDSVINSTINISTPNASENGKYLVIVEK